MFVTELFEAQERRVLVVYPGRFQPFHLGHLAVLKQLQAKFGADNVRIATSPNTVQDKIASGQKHDKKAIPKNPFNANEKVQLMKAAGVNDHQILLVNDPYGLDSVIQASNLDSNSTVLIFAVGAPDKERLEVDSVYQEFTPTGRKSNIPPGRAVGDEKPFKSLPKNLADTVVVAQGHAYVTVVPEKKVPFTINGKTLDISHGTECRATWNAVRNDPQERTAFLKTLYGRTTPELIHIFNKISPDTGVEPVAGTAPAKTATKLPAPAEPAGGMAVKRAAKKANTLVSEMGGVGVVKSGNDPRYVMATTGDQNAVTGQTLGREMKALHLAEIDDIDTGIAKMKQDLLDMIDVRINNIQNMVNGDPEAERVYAKKLQELKQKKLEIIVGRKLGAM